MYGEQLKICADCWEPKFVNKFAKDKYQKDGFQSRCRKCDKERQKIYNKENKKRLNAQRLEYRTNRFKNDASFNLITKTRGRIYSALKVKTKKKKERTIEYLGCNCNFYKDYIESLFTVGMTWEKYLNGEIHIDHITPISSFKVLNEEELKQAFHYTNTQPLWAKDNMKKGAKIL